MLAAVALFRALLITSVASGLIGTFLDLALPGLIPGPVAKALDTLPATPTPVLIAASALFVVTFGGSITAIIGLYFFQHWSRKLALGMTLLGLGFYPLFGVSVRSGWSQLLLDLSTFLWGCVVAMSFVSSLSARFEAQPRSPR